MYLNLHLKFLLSRSKQQGILQSSKKFETARLARNPLVWYSLLDGNEDLVTNVEFVCRLCYKFTCKIWNCAPYFDIINPKTFFERCPYKNLWIVLFSYQELLLGRWKRDPYHKNSKRGSCFWCLPSVTCGRLHTSLDKICTNLGQLQPPPV